MNIDDFMKEMTPIVSRAIDLVERDNEDEVMGRLANLGKKINNNSESIVEDMLEVALITFVIDAKERHNS